METVEKTGEEIEQEILNQFYTLIFMTNPMSGYVKIWISSDDLITYMKADKFCDLMAELIGEDIRYKVEVACSEYGGFYYIDRKKKELKSLSMTAVDYRMTPKEIFAMAESDKKSALIPKISDYTDNQMFNNIGKAYTVNTTGVTGNFFKNLLK